MERRNTLASAHLKQPELKALTGVRGVAAVVVALAHLHIMLPANLHMFYMWHNAAVDLFFVLSGFTLCYAYGYGTGRRLKVGKYLLARVARIYPLYALTLMIAWAIYVVHFTPPPAYPVGRLVRDAVAQLLTVNAWPLIGNGVHWNSPSWSVSVEVFCYVFAFPVIFLLPRMRSDAAILIITTLLMIGSYFLFMWYFDSRLLNSEIYTPPSAISYYVNPARGILGFVSGWLIYCAYINDGWLRRAAARGLGLVLVFAFAILVAWYYGVVNAQALLLTFPLIILGTADGRGLVARGLTCGPFQFLGEISYSIYLTHILVFVAFLRWAGLQPGEGSR